MKRTVIAAFALLIFAAAAHAAEEPQRYLVATKRPFRAGALADVVRNARQGAEALRNVEGFRSFDGFAADLTASEVAELRRNGAVRWVEPVIERHALAQQLARDPVGQTIPYGLDLIHAREAWLARPNGTINVAVLDTGVDYTHPELAGVWAGGHNFVDKNDNPLDDNGHGTHVAGTIAAANNSVGVVGVTANVRLWGLKVLNASGSGSNLLLVSAIDWLIEKKQALGGNWVVNLSLGSKNPSTAEREAFARAIAAGFLVVAASGNDSTPEAVAPVLYPAAYEGVFTVGAVDDTRTIASFSNQGPELDVVTPGVDILSTVPIATGSIAWASADNAKYVADAIDGSKRGTISGEYVYCGLGRAQDFPSSVAGKIALIRRGEIKFADKTRNAKERGAIAVAVFNNSDTSTFTNWTLIDPEDPTSATYDWPIAIGLSLADGETLLARSQASITLVHDADDYGFKSGTSMASPHAAAAAAQVWSAAATATAAEVMSALTATAADLGAPGPDSVFGAGLINVFEAVKRLAPASIDPTDPPPASRPSTGRRILKRG
ncbi:MAG TPA: S8 family serine peptidase [Thermoanaerobaculia bacterium]|nr:S8 family serine peptidase [Thermoanaerobaculia bacterium]